MVDRRVLSPCKQQCELSANRSHCIACRRTLDEIIAWNSYSDERRRAIMADLPARTIPLQKP
ncbi:MAG: DUF1289 domain-containing protein [Leptospiraceae bacterium]|nr:DUF1289 domain-containing protein [Leptospiraceae bacterium]